MDDFLPQLKNITEIEEFRVEDISHLHAGHNNFEGKTGSHFILHIKANTKANKIQLQKQITRLSYSCYKNGVHSISIKLE